MLHLASLLKIQGLEFRVSPTLNTNMLESIVMASIILSEDHKGLAVTEYSDHENTPIQVPL